MAIEILRVKEVNYDLETYARALLLVPKVYSSKLMLCYEFYIAILRSGNFLNLPKLSDS